MAKRNSPSDGSEEQLTWPEPGLFLSVAGDDEYGNREDTSFSFCPFSFDDSLTHEEWPLPVSAWPFGRRRHHHPCPDFLGMNEDPVEAIRAFEEDWDMITDPTFVPEETKAEKEKTEEPLGKKKKKRGGEEKEFSAAPESSTMAMGGGVLPEDEAEPMLKFSTVPGSTKAAGDGGIVPVGEEVKPEVQATVIVMNTLLELDDEFTCESHDGVYVFECRKKHLVFAVDCNPYSISVIVVRVDKSNQCHPGNHLGRVLSWIRQGHLVRATADEWPASMLWEKIDAARKCRRISHHEEAVFDEIAHMVDVEDNKGLQYYIGFVDRILFSTRKTQVDPEEFASSIRQCYTEFQPNI